MVNLGRERNEDRAQQGQSPLQMIGKKEELENQLIFNNPRSSILPGSAPDPIFLNIEIYKISHCTKKWPQIILQNLG